jgi:hypothetical protein
LTRGRAATPDPFDLSAVNRSDELFDALSTRRFSGDCDDPAATLLAALVADVDVDAPPLPARAPCPGPSARRRGTRAFVTFGVAALVLTSAGAAAAGGDNGVGAMGGIRGPARPTNAERSNENAQQRDPVTFLTGRRAPVRRTGARRSSLAPPEDTTARDNDLKSAPDEQWSHRPRRPARTYPHSPTDLPHSPNRPEPRASGRWTPSAPPEPTPTPTVS